MNTTVYERTTMNKETIEKVRNLFREIGPIQWKIVLGDSGDEKDFILAGGCGRESIESKRIAMIEAGFDVSPMWREVVRQGREFTWFSFTIAEK